MNTEKVNVVVSTPLNVARLCALIAKAKVDDIDSVYDPCVGDGALLAGFLNEFHDDRDPPSSVVGFDFSREAVDMADFKVSATLHSLPIRKQQKVSLTIAKNFFFHLLSEEAKSIYDVILINPPWEKPWEGFYKGDPRNSLPPSSFIRSEWGFILGCLYTLKPNGCMVAIMSPMSLHRDGYYDRNIREYLLDRNLVSAVIALPPKLLLDTDIPPVIVVFSTRYEGPHVRMIDASREYVNVGGNKNILTQTDTSFIMQNLRQFEDQKHIARTVIIDEIGQRDYSLLPGVYITPPNGFERVNIDKLSRECEALRIKNKENASPIDGMIDAIWREGERERERIPG